MELELKRKSRVVWTLQSWTLSALPVCPVDLMLKADSAGSVRDRSRTNRVRVFMLVESI